MKIEIKNRWNGNVIWTGEAEHLGAAVLLALASGADLRGAYLRDANLCDADLRYADLTNTNLRGADLIHANLGGIIKDSLDPAKAIGFTPDPTLPSRVAEAVLAEPNRLNMGFWHDEGAACGTTHCLAGWAIHLSGPAGYALEKVTSPSVAGALLMPSAAHLFYSDNETAIEWCRQQITKTN